MAGMCAHSGRGSWRLRYSRFVAGIFTVCLPAVLHQGPCNLRITLDMCVSILRAGMMSSSITRVCSVVAGNLVRLLLGNEKLCTRRCNGSAHANCCRPCFAWCVHWLVWKSHGQQPLMPQLEACAGTRCFWQYCVPALAAAGAYRSCGQASAVHNTVALHCKAKPASQRH